MFFHVLFLRFIQWRLVTLKKKGEAH